MRTCVVCRARRDDTEMVRAGRDAHGTWHLGRGVGRGVWWCRNATCGRALRVSHVARALRAVVSEGDVEVVRGLMADRGSKPRQV